ncbi:serine/threonine-protein kinase [Streptomyces paludis]|uniref:non-specific serine/threonine protein kinase n=1 Tax=Streptomyces paludis TaxID=2282738 RepID=A0A345HPB0_9ACTN|nr:serine/threonine-protein kinase [Streptomyces paludis]AXG78534.1 serine/threonine protein kinase [Streptomyces paludis]
MTQEGRLIAGRYRIAGLIGRGGMGTVWRAEDLVLDREVALKRLHATPDRLSADEIATLHERSRREARSAARIAHPHVVVVHDVVEDDGVPCLVMEYVRSVTLGSLLADGAAVPVREAVRIGLAMTGALRAAHTAGVVHRDVKPANVLLGDDGRIVLTDFGIALPSGASTLTATGEMIGSVRYMAPERVRGRTAGPASDLWSLGATLYRAVEGRLPFDRVTAMEMAYAIAVDPPGPTKLAGPLGPLIEALLAKEPEERPSAEEAERTLRTLWAAETETKTAENAEAANTTDGTTALEPVQEPIRDPAPEAIRATAAPAPPRRTRVLLRTATALAVAAATATGALYIWPDGGTGTRQQGTTPRSPAADTTSPPPLPAGYHLAEAAQLGVSLPVPDGWTVGRSSDEQVTYQSPSGLAGITIGTVDPAGSDLTAHFADIETNTKKNYTVYRRLRLQHTTFRGAPAAVWEFTFQGRARAFRAIDLGFGRAGEREYDIYLSAPDEDWDTYRPVFDRVKEGLRTP